MAHAVKEINQQADRQPHHKANPRHHRQAQHQREAHEYAEQRENRYERDTKWARSFRVNATQHVHSKTDQNEREERADIGQVGELTDVRNHRDDANNNSRPDGGDVRCAEARMNFGKICRQQTVAGHRHENARLPKLKH